MIDDDIFVVLVFTFNPVGFIEGYDFPIKFDKIGIKPYFYEGTGSALETTLAITADINV